MTMRPPLRSTRSKSASQPIEAERSGELLVSNIRTVPVQPITLSSSSSFSNSIRICSVPSASGLPKKPRHRMTDLQLERLEALYEQTTHPTREEKEKLGSDVGMSLKTVTIWFQNRRQTMRKRTNRHPSLSTATPVSTRESSCSKLSVFDAALPVPIKHIFFDPSLADHRAYRSPLAIVLNEGNKARKYAQEPGSKRVYSPPVEKYAPVEAEQLWKLLPSSPPTSTALSFSKYESSPTLDWLSNSKSVAVLPRPRPPGIPKKRSYPPGEKRTQVLEWACARLEKRRKLCEDHVSQGDSSESDTTEDMYSDDELSSRDSRNDLGDSKMKDGCAAPHIFIPPEYRALFAPDVILGASLLLTLKHSIGN